MTLLAIGAALGQIGKKVFPQHTEAVKISENYKQVEAQQDDTVKLAIAGGALIVILVIAVLYLRKK